MSTTIAVVVYDELPVAIRREHEAASAAWRSALDHALECGRLLAQAREGIAHGGWEAFVRDRCGIAPRTARLYLWLDANRERLTNRQRVAGLTVREAARLLAEPRAAVPEAVVELRGDEATGDEVRLAVPEWYRPGEAHAGSHPSGWSFKVWPHPAGEPWVHYFIVSGTSGFPGDDGGMLVGPQRGIRADALAWAMGMQRANGMPPLDDPAWLIGSLPVDAAVIATEPDYNSWFFNDEEDYRRRGMGLAGSRRRKAEVPA